MYKGDVKSAELKLKTAVLLGPVLKLNHAVGLSMLEHGPPPDNNGPSGMPLLQP